MLLGAVFPVWSAEAREAKMVRQHGALLSKTMLQWDRNNTTVLKKSYYQAWQKFVEEKKAAARDAEMLGKTLMKMGCQDNELIQSTIYTAWSRLLQEAKMMREHGEMLRRTMLQWDGQNTKNLLKACFEAWWQLHEEHARVRKDEAMLAKTLMQMGCQDRLVMMSAVFKHWAEEARTEKMVRQSGEMLKRTLLQWDSSSSRTLRKACFEAWCVLQEEIRRLKKDADMLGKTLLQMGSQDSIVILGTVIRYWSEDVRMEKLVRQSGEMLKRTIMQWDNGNVKVMKKTYFEAWWGLHVEAARMKKDAAVLGKTLMKMGCQDNMVITSTVFEHWAEHERKEKMLRQHGDMLKRTMMQWDSGNEKTTKKVLYDAWFTEVQEEKRARKDAEVLGKTLMQMGIQDRQLVLNTVFPAWHRLAQMEKMVRQHGEMLKKTMMQWDNQNNRTVLRAVLDAWLLEHRTHVAAKKDAEQLGRTLMTMGCQDNILVQNTIFTAWARHTSEQKMVKQHGEMLKKTMLMWDQQGTATLLTATFEGWQRVQSEEAAIRRNKDAASKALLQMGCKDDSMLLGAVLPAWSRAASEAKHERALEKNAEMLRKTMVQWDSKNVKVLVRSVFDAWLQEKREQANARKNADVLGKTLMQMDCQSNVVILNTVFPAWMRCTKEAIMVKKNGELLHKTMLKWDGDNKNVLLRTTFDAWLKEKREQAAARKHKEVLGKSLLQMGCKDDMLLLNTVFPAWERDAKQSVMVRKHGDMLKKTMLQWDNQSKTVLGHAVLEAWHSYQREQAHGRQHKDALMKTLLAMGVKDDSLLLSTILPAWCTAAREARHEKKVKNNEGMLRKTMMMWENGNKKMVKQNVLCAWHTELQEQKRAQKDADVLGKTLMQMGCQDRMLVLNTVFPAWMRVTKEDKMLREHGELLRRTMLQWDHRNVKVLLKTIFEGWREVHREQARMRKDGEILGKTLMQMGCQDRILLLNTIFMAWARTARMSAAGRRHGEILNKTLGQWDSQAHRELLQTTLDAWSQVKTQLIDAKKHGEVLAKTLLQMGAQDNKLLLGAVVPAWCKAAMMEKHEKLVQKSAETLTKTLMKWDSQSKDVLLKGTFEAWRKAAREQAYANKHQEVLMKSMLALGCQDAKLLQTAVFQEWAKEAKQEKMVRQHGDMLRKTMLQWDSQSQQVLLSVVTQEWAKEAKGEKMVRQHGDMLRKTMLHMDSQNQQALLGVVTQEWAKEAKQEKMMRQHGDMLHKTLMQWDRQSRQVALLSTFTPWHQAVVDRKGSRHQDDILDYAVVSWDVDADALLLLTVFAEWARQTSGRKAEKTKRQLLGKTFLVHSQAMDAICTHEMAFTCWRRLWRATKWKRDREKREAKIMMNCLCILSEHSKMLNLCFSEWSLEVVRAKHTAPNEVRHEFGLENIDFDALTEEQKTQMEVFIQEELAREAGVDASQVQIVFHEGSFQVKAHIITPVGEPRRLLEAHSALEPSEESAQRLATRIVDYAQRLPGMRAAMENADEPIRHVQSSARIMFQQPARSLLQEDLLLANERAVRKRMTELIYKLVGPMRLLSEAFQAMRRNVVYGRQFKLAKLFVSSGVTAQAELDQLVQMLVFSLWLEQRNAGRASEVQRRLKLKIVEQKAKLGQLFEGALGERSDTLLTGLFTVWKQSWQDMRHLRQNEDMIRKNAEMLRKTMMQWDSQSAQVLLGTVLQEWKTAARNLKHARAHEDVLRKTLMQMGCQDANLVLSTVVAAWHKEAQQNTLGRQCLEMLGRVVLMWDGSDAKMLMQLVWQAFGQVVAQQVARRKAERVLTEALHAWRREGDSEVLGLVMKVWRNFSEGERSLAGQSQRHQQLLGKTMLTWSGQNDKARLRSCFDVFKEASERLAKLRKEEWDLQCVLLLLQTGDEQALLRTLLQVWMDETEKHRRRKATDGLVNRTIGLWSQKSDKGLQLAVLQAWRTDLVAEAQQRRAFQKSRTELMFSCGRLMQRCSSEADEVLVQSAFLAWCQYAGARKEERKANGVVARAVSLWEDEALQEQKRHVFQAWAQLCAHGHEISAQVEVAKKEQKAETLLAVGRVVQTWEAEIVAFLANVAFQAWRQCCRVSKLGVGADTVVQKALLCWSRDSSTRLCQIVLQAWAKAGDARRMRLASVAQRQAFSELVFTSKTSTLPRAVLRAWLEVMLQSQVEQQKDVLVSVMNQWNTRDERLSNLLEVRKCFAAWNAVMRCGCVARHSEAVMGKALLAWSSEGVKLQLQMVWKEWLAYVSAAETEKQMLRAKRYHGFELYIWTERTLEMWDSETRRACVSVAFVAWCGYIRELQQKRRRSAIVGKAVTALASELQDTLAKSVFGGWAAEAAHVRAAGREEQAARARTLRMLEGVERLWGAGDDETQVRVAFGGWAVWCENVRRFKKMNGSMGQAVLCWGADADKLLLRFVWQRWAEELSQRRELSESLTQWMSLQRLERLQVIGRTITTWEKDAAEYLLAASLRLWRQACTTGAAARRARKAIGQSLLCWQSNDDMKLLNLVFVAYQHGVEQLRAERSQARERYVLGCTLQVWSRQDEEGVLRFALQAWVYAREQERSKIKLMKADATVLMAISGWLQEGGELMVRIVWQAWAKARLQTSVEDSLRKLSRGKAAWGAFADKMSSTSVLRATFQAWVAGGCLSEARQEDAAVLGKALLSWQGQDERTSLHMVLRAWVADWQEQVATRARVEETRAQLKEEQLVTMGRTLQKCGAETDELLLLVAFVAWMQICQHDKLHRRFIGTSLLMMATSSDRLQLQVMLATWRKHTTDAAHEAQASETKRRHAAEMNSLTGRSLLAWQMESQKGCLAVALVSWRRQVAEVLRARGAKAATAKALSMLSSDVEDQICKAVVVVWAEMVQHIRLSASASSAWRQKSEQMLHRTLNTWDSESEELLCCMAFGAWSSHRSHLRRIRAAGNAVDRAVMGWTTTCDTTALRLCWGAWILVVHEARHAADSKRQEQRLLAAKRQKLDATLQCWASESAQGLRAAVLRAWRSATQASHREQRGASACQQALAYWSLESQTLMLRSMLLSWADYCAHRREMSEALTELTQVQRSERLQMMGRTVAGWESDAEATLLAVCLGFWQLLRSAAWQQRRGSRTLARSMLFWQEEDAKTLLTVLWSAWRTQCEHTKRRTEVEQTLREHALHMVGRTIQCWQEEGASELLGVVFKAWQHAQRLGASQRHLADFEARSRFVLDCGLKAWQGDESAGFAHQLLLAWQRCCERQRSVSKLRRADVCVDIAMSKWTARDGFFLLQLVWQVWLQELEAAHLSEASRRVHEELSARRYQNLEAALVGWTRASHAHMLALVTSAWQNMAARQRARRRAEQVTTKTLACWAVQSDKDLLQVAWHSWAAAHRAVVGLRKTAEETTLRLKNEQLFRVGKTMQQWTEEVDSYLMLVTFQSWLQDYKRGHLSREWGRCTDVALDIANGDALRDLLHVVVDAWRAMLAEEQGRLALSAAAARATEQRQQLLRKGFRAVDQAMLIWSSADVQQLLHAVLLLWRQSQQRCRLRRHADGCVDAALSSWSQDAAKELLHTCMRAWGADWRLAVRHRAAEQAAETAAERLQQQARKSQVVVGAALRTCACEGDSGLVRLVVGLWRHLCLRRHRDEKAERCVGAALLVLRGESQREITHAAFDAWRVLLTEGQGRTALEEAVARASEQRQKMLKKNAVTLGEALLSWSSSDASQVARSVLLLWRSATEAATEARQGQRQSRLMRLEKIASTVHALDGERESATLSVAFVAWMHFYWHETRDATLRTTLQGALAYWSDEADGSIMKLVLHSWACEIYRTKSQGEATKAERKLGMTALGRTMQKWEAESGEFMLLLTFSEWLQSARRRLQEKRARRALGTALQCWNGASDGGLLSSAFRGWAACRLLNGCRRRYDGCVTEAVTLWSRDSEAQLLKHVWQRWLHCILEQQMASKAVEHERDRRGLKERCSGRLLDLSLRIARSVDSALSATVLESWHTVAQVAANEKQLALQSKAELAEVRREQGEVLEKAMSQWRSEEVTVMLHVVMSSWLRVCLEEKEIDAQAAHLATQLRNKEQHKLHHMHTSEKILASWESSSASSLTRLAFQGWCDSVAMWKSEQEMNVLTSRMRGAMAGRQADVTNLKEAIYRTSLLHTTYNRWSSFAAQSCRQQDVQRTRERGHRAVDAADETAGQLAAVVLLRSAFGAMVAAATRTKRAKAAKLERGLFVCVERGDQAFETCVLLQTTFHGWAGETARECRRQEVAKVRERGGQAIDVADALADQATSVILLRLVFGAMFEFALAARRERERQKEAEQLKKIDRTEHVVSLLEEKRRTAAALLLITKGTGWVKAALAAWRATILLEREHAKILGQVVDEAKTSRSLHGRQLRKLAEDLFGADSEALLRHLYSCWLCATQEGIYTDRFRAREEYLVEKQHTVLDGVAASWGIADDAAIQKACLHHWWREMASAKREGDQAANQRDMQLAKKRQRQLKAAAADILVSRWEADNVSALQMGCLRGWHAMMTLAHQEDEAAAAAASAQAEFEQRLLSVQGEMATAKADWAMQAEDYEHRLSMAKAEAEAKMAAAATTFGAQISATKEAADSAAAESTADWQRRWSSAKAKAEEKASAMEIEYGRRLSVATMKHRKLRADAAESLTKRWMGRMKATRRRMYFRGWRAAIFLARAQLETTAASADSSAKVAAMRHKRLMDVGKLWKSCDRELLKQTLFDRWTGVCKSEGPLSHLRNRTGNLVDVADTMWNEMDRVLLLRHILVAWSVDTAVERETRCREALLVQEENTRLRRDQATDALGRVRYGAYMQDLLSNWHLAVKKERSKMPMDVVHTLSHLCIGTEHRAAEHVAQHTVKAEMATKLQAHCDHHHRKFQEVDRELELLAGDLQMAMKMKAPLKPGEAAVVAQNGSPSNGGSTERMTSMPSSTNSEATHAAGAAQRPPTQQELAALSPKTTQRLLSAGFKLDFHGQEVTRQTSQPLSYSLCEEVQHFKIDTAR
eukprot:TRINITY_DN21182_c0_g2_i1.p1 TRINITY_DN21182_c0_g2~~TRINITY_DN21182_c0_g2_i1.p1  ORF type:complete len:5179 (+),score=1577.24 TRINITY_DN21182_c0_g2_i1:558-15539(+)